MNRSGRKAAGLVIAALLTNGVFAMGLGEASGRAVLGQPLHLEIPILGGDGSAALKSCFRLRAPRAEVGNDFAVRNARADVVGARLLVTTATAVTEPVIGFAVEATCGGLSRDYVLLVGLPAAPAPAPAVETPRAAAPAEPAPATMTAPEKTAAPGDVLRVAAPLTLEALARQKYPLQPKAREKFMRMMTEANPGLISGDAPIAAGTELRIPPGLPQRRIGPYLGEATAAPPKKPAATEAPPESAKVATPAAKPSSAPKPGKDRLLLGRAPESNEARLLAEAERLTNMLVEQTRTQEEMTASLAQMEAHYAELHKQLIAMQTQLARVEAERVAERRAAAESARTSQLVELLAAVLGGGAVGGIGLHLFQRRRLQKKADDDDAGYEEEDLPAALAAPSVPVSRKPAVPPWIAGKAPANEASAREAKVSPAAMIAAVTEAAIGELAAPSHANAEAGLPAPQSVSLNPPPDEGSPLVRQERTEAAETPALPAAQLETPEPPVVLEPLDFSPVAIEKGEKEPPRPPVAEETAHETLTLDFPEITIPGAEQGDTLDFRKE